jgi:hypothetical protein
VGLKDIFLEGGKWGGRSGGGGGGCRRAVARWAGAGRRRRSVQREGRREETRGGGVAAGPKVIAKRVMTGLQEDVRVSVNGWIHGANAGGPHDHSSVVTGSLCGFFA